MERQSFDLIHLSRRAGHDWLHITTVPCGECVAENAAILIGANTVDHGEFEIVCPDCGNGSKEHLLGKSLVTVVGNEE